MADAVTVTDLVVRRGALTAVDGVSLSVGVGEIVALLGPNGAGKTTTVEVVAGLASPDRGSVTVLGRDPRDRGATTRHVGVMPQDGGVHPGLKVAEALHLYAAQYDEHDDVDGLLARVGLADRRDSTWRSLSGGEQQRLSLALAVVGLPRVALLDEPTSGVDPAGRRAIRDLVADLAGRGTAILVTTHELAEAERFADQVVIIDRGKVVASGRPDELAGGADDVRFGAPPGLDVESLARAVSAPVTEVAPGEYRVAAPPAPATVAAITAWLAERELALGDLRAGRRSLEEVYLRLVGGES